MNNSTTAQFLGNRWDEAKTFFRLIAPTGDAFYYRTFSDNKDTSTNLARKFHGPFKEIAPKLEELNDQRAGVFVVINAGGQTKDEITRVRAVFADTDGAPLSAAFITPSASYGGRIIAGKVACVLVCCR